MQMIYLTTRYKNGGLYKSKTEWITTKKRKKDNC